MAASAGLVWFLSQKVSGAAANRAEKKQSSVLKEILPDEIEKLAGELAKKIEQLIPSEVKKQIEDTQAKVLGESNKLMEESQTVKQLKQMISDSAAQITGFPEKQKKEVKREIIKEVCEQLLKEN